VIKEKSRPVAVMIAPSIVGQFPYSMPQLVSALREIGFDIVWEVAHGADKTARAEAIELKEKMDEGQNILGTSCCPAYTEAVVKHVPAFLPKVSHTPTPMAFSAEDVRREYPDAVTVFVGPCTAKRYEGIRNSHVDYVLTYEELGCFFMAKNVKADQLPDGKFDSEDASSQARRFGISSGVAGAVISYAEGVTVKPSVINGLDRAGMRQLKKIASTGDPNANLLEVMSCEGGCICGPGIASNPVISRRKLDEYSK